VCTQTVTIEDENAKGLAFHLEVRSRLSTTMMSPQDPSFAFPHSHNMLLGHIGRYNLVQSPGAFILA
jgi:hypothetical protein